MYIYLRMKKCLCACVYVIQIFPEIRGPKKPKFMLDHNRIQNLCMLKQLRALKTVSFGVTRQRRSLSPVYNAVTSPTLYKAEAEAEAEG